MEKLEPNAAADSAELYHKYIKPLIDWETNPVGAAQVTGAVAHGLGAQSLAGWRGVRAMLTPGEDAGAAVERTQEQLGPHDLGDAGIKAVQSIAPLYRGVTGSPVGQAASWLGDRYSEGVNTDADLVGKYLGPAAGGLTQAAGAVAPMLAGPGEGEAAAPAARALPSYFEPLLADGAHEGTLAREAAANARRAEDGLPVADVPPSEFQGRQAEHEGAVARREKAPLALSVKPATEVGHPEAGLIGYHPDAQVVDAHDPDGGHLGRLIMEPGDGMYQSRTSDVFDEANRGRGIGTDMLRRGVDFAHDQGMHFGSDAKLSPPQMAVYMKLRDQGYPVTLNPTADVTPDNFMTSGDKGPVITIPHPDAVDDDAGPGNYIASQAHAKGGEVGTALGGLGDLIKTYAPLKGMPARATIPGHGTVDVGPHQPARDAAAAYMKTAGLPYNPPSTYRQVDPAHAAQIAHAFDAMPHAPDDPAVRASYDAMIRETLGQYQHMKNTGLNVEFMPHGQDPYAASPRLAAEDVKNNNHLYIYPTAEGHGTGDAAASAGNPLLGDSGESFGGVPATHNDVFRAVHDYFGHIKEGVGFRANGEENAWRQHAGMYSDLARPAMTSETRGQNSWVNFGPHGPSNQLASSANTVYAPQKVGLLPDEFNRLDDPELHFLHMSNLSTPTATLDPRFYGTGIKGAEAKRGGTKVTSLYPADIAASDIEHGLESKTPYRVSVPAENMYNLNEDSLGLRGANDDFNDVENAIKAAGYAGYHVPEGQGLFKGQGRLFQPTQATRLGPGPAPEVEEDLSAGFAEGGEVGAALGPLAELVAKYAPETGVPFKTRAFHGTDTAFSPGSKMDPALRGSVSQSSDAKKAFWLTDSRDRAYRAAKDANDVSGTNQPYVGKWDLTSRNPLVISKSIRDMDPSQSAKLLTKAQKAGHDSVVFIKGEDDVPDYAFFNPDSATFVDHHVLGEEDSSIGNPQPLPPQRFADGGGVEGALLGGVGELIAKYAPEAEHLAHAVATDGSVTYNPTTGDLHGTGYLVPTHPHRSVALDAPPAAEDIHNFLLQHQDAFDEDPNAALHVHGDDNGNHFMHVAHVTPDFGHASDVAAQSGLPGFQDLASKEIHPASTIARDLPESSPGSTDQSLVEKYLSGPSHLSTPWTPGKQTVANPKRNAFPGIYNDPRKVIQDASSKVGPEDPLLQQLFGVSRSDLSDLALSRQGNELGSLPGAKQNPTGAASARDVMTSANAQRLIDVLGDARNSPELYKGMTGWYTMDPLYQRFQQMYGDDEAPGRFEKFITLMGMASPGSNVHTEIARGTAAHWLDAQGRFQDFLKYGGGKEAATGTQKLGTPEDMLNVPGHAYHRTAQGGPMDDYLRTGSVQMQSPKVPPYIRSSGVPQTGFQTDLPVGDAHFARATGLADTRGTRTSGGQEIVPGSSVSTPEMQTLHPWWRDKVAAQAGLESVPAQALAWGAFSPYTGVESAIGAPKLEILSTQIGKLAQRLGVSPETARDMVISGKAGAFAEGGSVAGPVMSTLTDLVAKYAPDMKPMSSTLLRGTEGGNPAARLRVTGDGEMGPGTYATQHQWLASSYGGGPKASVAKGTRVVHSMPIGPLEPKHVGYVYQGLNDTNGIAHLSDNRGDILHWFDALGNTPEARQSRQDLVKVAKQNGMKILVGHDDSIATNQVNILDHSVLQDPQATPPGPTQAE